jgi:hypothetical protein
MALQRLNPPSLISARQAERGGYRITFSPFQEPNVKSIEFSFPRFFQFFAKRMSNSLLGVPAAAGENFRSLDTTPFLARH